MEILGIIIGVLANCIVTSLILSPILKLACWIVTRFSPPLKMAFKASFLGMFISTVVFAFSILGALFMGASNLNTDNMFMASVLFITITAVCFLIQTAIYGKVLQTSEGNSIGFLKALLANIIVYVVIIVIVACICLTIAFLQ